MKTQSQNQNLREKQTYLIHAVICSPSPNAKRHCNCDVYIVMSDLCKPDIFICEARRWIRGGWNSPMPNLGITWELERSDLAEYWAKKIRNEKQADVMNLNEVRQEMRDFVNECFSNKNVLFSNDCLYRFTWAQQANPWDGYFCGWGRCHSDEYTCELLEPGNCFDSSLDDFSFRMFRERTRRETGKFYDMEWWVRKFRPQIAAWHVMPIRYVQHWKPRNTLQEDHHRMWPSPDVFGYPSPKLGVSDYTNFFVTIEQIRKPLSKKQIELQPVVKAIERAVAKGKLSTRMARAWFKKHQILNRLNDGLKARKTQQPIEEIAA
jgi:hypothetical protein